MGDPLRVLHVVVNMNRGGAETLIMNLYRNIDRSRVQFDFLTYKEGVFDEEIKKLGGKVHRIPYISEVGHKQFVKGLDTFFRQHFHYKIVHSHMDKMSGLVLRSAKRYGVTARIAHSHNTSSEGGFLTRLYKEYAGIFIKNNATHLYACSNLAAQWLFPKRVNEALIIKNGIDSEKFTYSSTLRKQIRKELNLYEDTHVIGHVGRFSLQKNHMFLIEVFAEYSRKKPNSRLLLIGDGPLRSKIIEKIKVLRLEDKVQLLGIREDIPSLLQAIDVFLFPSFHEGLPVTLIEAQGAGLHCFISDKISGEVDLGLGLMERLPISSEAQAIWVQKLLEKSSFQSQRLISSKKLNQSGYDIHLTARKTENSYLRLGGRAG
ncbi:glycosyl transferase family 1 [Halobacillus halophilus]|uniref:Group 1 glycosyltransferase n=1 Tax=Halobacillus halophilus (strain ATCC 35676 / DSM 2266 / JCM 20832 / KCTC 3685 / LMG 17431 / NBRC 102448 / NCIMB 2269) TaxID=866895 RepID=I0JJK9_HALH3|nr:glycosyltransferase family 1 protein [Halobacillus halophilus]ASF38482.1 glycosyl transferase family 1 [Halobacillus halophilus]CCG44327.1 group 1 glycosyltransferase [Halobacillus halophilus DSM 2266]